MMNTTNNSKRTFQTLQDLRQYKQELSASIDEHGEVIASLWHELSVPQKANTKGEMIASLISNSITAFDAFLLARKIMKQYGSFFHRRKKK